MRNALTLLLVIASLTLCQSGNEPPAYQPRPVFQSELWPGEGEPKFSAKKGHLVLHTRPSSNATRARRRKVTLGGAVPYSETRLITLKSGVIEVTHPGELQARSLGEIRYLSGDDYYQKGSRFQAMAVEKGERLQYLQYRAEGSCLAKRGRSVYEIEGCDFGESSPLKLRSEPVVEWWIRLPREGQNPTGWLRVSEQVVNFLPRAF
jgi:hypothetical protein